MASKAPVNTSGKMFDYTLKDVNNKLSVIALIENWLLTVNKRDLPGKFKIWIL